MKRNKGLLFSVILLGILMFSLKVNAASSSTYFEGKSITIEQQENFELITTEINIDEENSLIENSFIVRNATNKDITTKIQIPVAGKVLVEKTENFELTINNNKVKAMADENGVINLNIKFTPNEAKEITLKYNTDNNLKNAKVIKYLLEDWNGYTIKKFKATIKLAEEDVPLVTAIYPECYEFKDNTISVEYYNFKVNALSNNVIVEKETYKDLLYGQDSNFTDSETKVLKNAKTLIKNGLTIDYEKEKKTSQITSGTGSREITAIDNANVIEHYLNDNGLKYGSNSIIESICEYAIFKQIVKDGRLDLRDQAFRTQREISSDWNHPLTEEYIESQSPKEDYPLYGKKVCIDYVESEGDKELYIYRMTKEAENPTDNEYDYVKTSEWDILKIKNHRFWYYCKPGARMIYVGQDISGNKLNVTEQEKIEYINMINVDLYIRMIIYDGNVKTTHLFEGITDATGKAQYDEHEGWITGMTAYYRNEDRQIATGYVSYSEDVIAFKDYYNNGTYTNKYYSEVINKFSNDVISNNSKVPTIAHSIGYRTTEEGKYVINFFGGTCYSNGLGEIEGAINTSRAQELINSNKAQNEKIKSSVEKEIEDITISKQTGIVIEKTNNDSQQNEEKNNVIDYQNKDFWILNGIVFAIFICIALLIIKAIKSKKNR